MGSFRQNARRSRVPGAAQHEVVRCRPGTVSVRGGPGSATHRFAPLALHRIRDTRYRPLHSSFHSHDSNSPSRSPGAFLRERAFGAARAGWSDPSIFLFFCRFGSSIPGLTISSTHTSSFPRRISAPGVCNFASLTPNRGVGGAPRDVRVLSGTPVGPAHDAAGQALARRLASHDAGRSPLGAPPWRFWAPGAALPSPWAPAVLQRRAVALRIRAASSSHPGRSTWRAGSLPPEANGYEPPPQDAMPRSAFRIVSRTRPQ